MSWDYTPRFGGARQKSMSLCGICNSSVAYTSYVHTLHSVTNAQEREDEEHERGEGGEGGEGGESAHEMIETIQEGEMPLKDYLWMHPEARLTAAEQQQLIDGIRATFQ